MYISVKKIITTGVILLAVFIIAIFCCRNILVRYYIGRKLENVEKQCRLTIHYKNITMAGLSGIQIDDLSVVPFQSDTFLHVSSFRVQLNLSDLLLLRIAINSIDVNNVNIAFVKENNSTSNFDFLYQVVTPDQPLKVTKKERNYALKVKKTLNMLFKLFPDNATMHNLCVSYKNKGDALLIEIPSLMIKENQFVTKIKSTENGVSNEWGCEGGVQDKEKKIEVRLHTSENTKITLPFLYHRWGVSVQFDTLSFELGELKSKTSLYGIGGMAHLSGLTLHQERISPDTVLLDQATCNWQVNVGSNYLELDSTSEIRFNKLNFHPYLKVKKDTDWKVTASINNQNFPANDLFASLPQGLFYNLEGLDAKGTLSFHFLLDIDFALLDSLQFESTLSSSNFQIARFGNTDLRKMNEPFMYTAYEQGEPVRTFEIGEENPDFRTFDAISRFLPLVIMQSEDAGFFHHNGFIPSAIRESLIVDLQEKRFARGGSTLSMQLVKNVFLSRNKTIVRKLEEILIVWLIENNRLTSKERMFEVYLNIVEWGPLIYGATEASRFYFAKDPSSLTLSECIFLASIIPKPRHVRNCFDGLQLKPYYNDFYKIIITRLIDRELITPEEGEEIGPEAVKITGPAKELLVSPIDTIQNPLSL